MYTVSTEVSRETTYCLDTRRASAVPTAANQHPADRPNATIAISNRAEVRPRAVDWAEANQAPRVQTEGDVGPATCPLTCNRNSGGTKGIGGYGESDQSEGTTGEMADPIQPVEVPGPISPPNANMAEVDTRVPAAFWRLLEDVGYEIW